MSAAGSEESLLCPVPRGPAWGGAELSAQAGEGRAFRSERSIRALMRHISFPVRFSVAAGP